MMDKPRYFIADSHNILQMLNATNSNLERATMLKEFLNTAVERGVQFAIDTLKDTLDDI